MVFLMKLLHHLSCHNAKIASFCPTRLLQYYTADGAVYNLASRGYNHMTVLEDMMKAAKHIALLEI